MSMAERARDERVLILLDASAAWSRGVLRGFTAAARQKGWLLLHYHTTVDLRWLARVWKPTVVVLQWSRSIVPSPARSVHPRSSP
jgi:hypothetical protein